MKKYAYLNGKIVDINKPALLLNDIGLLRGYGVFDFMRTYNGRVFYWADHFKRFVNSAKILGLRVPSKKQELEDIIYKLLKKNQLHEGSIRLVLTGGPTIDGTSYSVARPTFAVLIEDPYTVSKKMTEDGVKLITEDYQRLFPEAKTLNYILTINRQPKKKQNKAYEILYTLNGEVLEGSMSNFFIFKGDTLVTAESGVLPGITRKIVLDLAKSKFKVEVQPIKVEELGEATEAFITGTNKEVLPVTDINGVKIGSGRPGQNTKTLGALYRELTDKN